MGFDYQQRSDLEQRKPRFGGRLEGLWRRGGGDMLLKGIKVGVLKEGFENLLTGPKVEATSAPHERGRA
jgi:hypothetical protein